MTIKEFAYIAQQHFQAQTGQNFKRTHIYELLAASFGYNSFAALCAESVVIHGEKNSNSSFMYIPEIRNRSIELGYLPEIANIFSNSFPTFIAEWQISIVNIMELKSIIAERFMDDDDSISPELIAELDLAAAGGNALAHYGLALIYGANDDDDGGEVGADYWFNQEKNGRILKGVEKQWADAYKNKMANDEKYEFHLREAGRLGHEEALLDLAERFDDPAFFEKVKASPGHDPSRVVEIAESLGRDKDIHAWLTIAAESGDIYAMRRLIEEFDQNDLMRCWTWIYLAQLLETDLSKDDYHAIHENGSLYDDDVGGPMFVDGEQGIELRPLNVEQDNLVRQNAQKLFDKIND
jgi:hypothetical protein